MDLILKTPLQQRSNRLDQISEYRGPVELIHKIDQHTAHHSLFPTFAEVDM